MINLQYILKQIESLTPEQQKVLSNFLNEKTKQPTDSPPVRRKWRSICGSAPNLLKGEDAQQWVSRMRRGEE